MGAGAGTMPVSMPARVGGPGKVANCRARNDARQAARALNEDCNGGAKTLNWWGKLIGGTLGFVLGGPIGVLIGVVVGHHFDQPASGNWQAGADTAARAQATFFTATFSVMGYLAKSDGRVSEHEIRLAREVMRHMRLDAAQTDAAMRLFGEGKQAGFPVDEVLDQFRRECRGRRDLIHVFLQIQVQAALADGVMDQQERTALTDIAGRLGVSQPELQQIISLVEAFMRHGGGASGAPRTDELAEAYSILGVSRDSDDAVVKRAYRKLMSEHHPDKLVSRGLPEEMMRIAEEKTVEIRAAYERIKTARGMK